MDTRNKLERFAALFTAICCLIVFVAYLSNLNSGPFEDDFGWVKMATTAVARGYFSVWTDAFGCFFFRPLNMGLLLLSLKVGSWTLAHGGALAVHLCFSVAVACLAARLFPGLKSRWLMLALACAFFVHQGNATTVLQLDTSGQCTSDFFSAIALIAAVAYASSGTRWLIVASLASLLAMLGKEGGVPTILAVIVTVGIFASRGVRARKLASILAAETAAGLAYFLWRTHVQNLIPPPQEVLTRYSFGLRFETLRNLGKFIVVEIVPWNSASLAWNRRPEEWVLGLAFAVFVGVAALVGWRRLIKKEPRSKMVLIWLQLVFLLWCTPYVFLGGVSEDEVYRLASITVLIFGFGCWASLQSGVARLAVPALVAWCAWVGIGGTASVEKCMVLRSNARVAGEMVEAMGQALGDASETREVWVFIVPSPRPSRRYGIVYVSEPALRIRAPVGLPWYLKNPDLRVQVFLPGDTVPKNPEDFEHLKALRADITKGLAEPIAVPTR
jgi:hypothetical protein